MRIDWLTRDLTRGKGIKYENTKSHSTCWQEWEKYNSICNCCSHPWQVLGLWLLQFRMQIIRRGAVETAMLSVKFVFHFHFGHKSAVDRHSNRILVPLWQVIRKYLNKRTLFVTLNEAYSKWPPTLSGVCVAYLTLVFRHIMQNKHANKICS